MKRTWIWVVCVLVVLLDLGLTFVQSYHLRLDGDIAAIVLPRADYSYVLHDPFGWRVLTQGAWYAVPNRFFAYAGMYWYFRQVPLLLQSFLSPISSVYAALALFNTSVQALLLYVLGWYASGTRHLGRRRLWLAMALMTPFFQATGYHMQMSLVVPSISFSFAYSFPLVLLLVLLWPLYRAARQGQPLQLSWPALVAALALAVVLAFNGPIIPGVVLVLGLGVGLHAGWRWWQTRRLPLAWQAVLLWGWLGGLCLYSLYIGRHNTEDLMASLPVASRYQLLPAGLLNQLTVRLGLPLLILGCLANWWLLRRLPATPERRRARQLLGWLGGFALMYILLLPLGGYRGYRPLILRYDTILPITAGLVAFYGLSAGYLLVDLRGGQWRGYLVGVLVIAAIFVNADRKLYPGDDNRCERQALEHLAWAGPEPAVQLPGGCRVMSWEPITDPIESITAAELLQVWGITKSRKLYYCPAQ